MRNARKVIRGSGENGESIGPGLNLTRARALSAADPGVVNTRDLFAHHTRLKLARPPRFAGLHVSEAGNTLLITGATGNVGREVVRALQACGSTVRLAGRQVSGAALGGPALDQVRLDFKDPATFAAALAGTHGVFLMRPNPVLAVKKTLNRFLDVAADQGVTHCVFLSVAGADKNHRVPHHAVEQHLMRGSLRWTILRAGFFAQNLSGPYREDILDGTIILPAGSGKVAYVDTRDLGEVAALALRAPDKHAGQAYHLTGSESFSFYQVAELLSESLGRPIVYQPASIWRYWRHCRARAIGIVPTLAYTLVHATLRGGSGAAIDPTLATLLGRPARTLRHFIEEHRSAWASPLVHTQGVSR